MRTERSHPSDELLLAGRDLSPGVRQNVLSVPSIHCGACVQRVERVLGRLPGVERARANLSTKRVTVDWRGEAPPPLISALAEAGFDAHLNDFSASEEDSTLRHLVRAVAVAGFAAGNVMMLSVGIWSGADPGTRDLFHWLSAAIALPSLAYCGQVFFLSAWQALRRGQTNMDVPISIGVLLAFGMSLYETAHHAEHAYFDAALCLLFFLLVGRALDQVMRTRTRTALRNLARLGARGASVLQPDGSARYVPVGDIQPGMTLLLAAGERIPVDARVIEGRSELDVSLVSGESVPRAVTVGDAVPAGTLNLAGPIKIEARAAARDSFLAEIMRMVEVAEAGRATYRRIADRAARLYAPVVHVTALLTFAAWMVVGADVHHAVMVAIAVLIITCPCALGLAVPMVQVVAAQRLLEQGILLKDGDALERLAEVDRVEIDKTGTLTKGAPELVDAGTDPDALAIAAAIAVYSRHPYSQALAAAGQARGLAAVRVEEAKEHAGLGLEARVAGRAYRLGRAEWALAPGVGRRGVVLARDGRLVAGFGFREELGPGAREMAAALTSKGMPVEILSGDRDETVRQIATELGVPYVAGVSPGRKVARIATLAAEGRKVLMVGDGLNDTPSLAAAHVSMATASAADIGRNAADIVFLRDDLGAIGEAIETAHRAANLVRQNLLLAIGYNVFAVPVAVLGQVTPIVAAIAMSASSLVVVSNALRLARRPRNKAGLSVPASGFESAQVEAGAA
jgi:Cu2+-exporting ATPase